MIRVSGAITAHWRKGLFVRLPKEGDLTKCENWREALLCVLPGEGGTPLYEVYRYVPPQRVWFLSRFGLKTGIDFEHFGLKLGMVIEGMFTKAYKPIFLPSNRR